MKKIIAILMVLALACSICSCGFRWWPSFTTQTTKDINQPSEGLYFVLNEDGVSYCVSSKGTCSDYNIVIPGTYNGLPVTKIGPHAFYNSYGVNSVIIPNSVISIGAEAFAKCHSLQSIIIPNSVKTIEESTFEYCTGLNSVVISDSVESIGENAFSNCKTLTNITIPNSVQSIGENAFWECTALTSVVIGDSLENIGPGAFAYCDALTSINVDANNEFFKSIDGNLYSKDGTNLIQYAINKKDTSFVIPDTVTTIHFYAFGACTALTSIEIPDSVTTIGGRAFYGCTSLVEVEIPASVTNIGDAPFPYCNSLRDIKVDENNEFYQSIGGNLYTKDGTKLIQYLQTLKDKLFVIPDTITTIGDLAFGNCTYLETIEIPDSVTTIERFAFDGCTSLENIIIPDSVTSIGEGAFSYCNSLASIIIPDSVTSIGEDAFYGCDSLSNIVYKGTMEQWNNIEKGNSWHYMVSATKVICSDGYVSIR